MTPSPGSVVWLPWVWVVVPIESAMKGSCPAIVWGPFGAMVVCPARFTGVPAPRKTCRKDELLFQPLGVGPESRFPALTRARRPRTAIAKPHRRLPSPGLIERDRHDTRERADRGGRPSEDRSGSRIGTLDLCRSGATPPPRVTPLPLQFRSPRIPNSNGKPELTSRVGHVRPVVFGSTGPILTPDTSGETRTRRASRIAAWRGPASPAG